MTFSYDFWHRALAGQKVGGETLPVHDGVAHPGFYRKRMARKGPWVPVAIFEDDGELIALVGAEKVDPAGIWTFCCRNAVSEAAYHSFVETGEWFDLDQNIAPPPTPIGHNEPADEAEMMRDQIDSAKRGISDYSIIEDDTMAKRAQSLRSRLLELSREADKKREAEKKPHFEASKDAKAAADGIAAALNTYETAKARAAAEERRRAEEAERKAAEAGKPVPLPAPAPQPLPTQIKGGYGRAANIKIVKVVTAVTDWQALYNFMKDRAEVTDVLLKLAQRAVDAGHEVPGVTVEEQRKVA